MNETLLITVAVSIVSSVVAGFLVLWAVAYKERRVKKQIEDINSLEDYLESLSKGNQKLLRSSLTLIFILFFLFSAAGFVWMLNEFLNISSVLRYYIPIWFFGTSAALSIYQARAIIQSADLKGSKDKLDKKRQKLKNKLSNSQPPA